MKEVKQKLKMKSAKVLNTVSRAPRDMKDAMLRMQKHALDHSENQETITEYGEAVIIDSVEQTADASVRAVHASIRKATKKAKESYTDHSTYKGGKEHAEKQAQSAYQTNTHQYTKRYTQIPKTQPKNTVPSLQQGSYTAKTTQRTLKASTKTVKATSKTAKTANAAEKTAKTARNAANTTRETAKKASQGIKATGRAIVHTIKAVINEIKAFIAAIVAGGGGAVIIILFLSLIHI